MKVASIVLVVGETVVAEWVADVVAWAGTGAGAASQACRRQARYRALQRNGLQGALASSHRTTAARISSAITRRSRTATPCSKVRWSTLSRNMTRSRVWTALCKSWAAFKKPVATTKAGVATSGARVAATGATGAVIGAVAAVAVATAAAATATTVPTVAVFAMGATAAAATVAAFAAAAMAVAAITAPMVDTAAAPAAAATMAAAAAAAAPATAAAMVAATAAANGEPDLRFTDAIAPGQYRALFISRSGQRQRTLPRSGGTDSAALMHLHPHCGKIKLRCGPSQS
mmetsp:Transcript_59955/g.99516  ORF Transcript_59955/g.99516 Transcript_59955/m.99516 type:complete len:287 (-) Transcript_59955:70-930(-)